MAKKAAENMISPTSAEDAMFQMEQTQPQRLVYWYDIPPRLVALTGIKKVGLIELTSGEEMMATNRTGTNVARLAFEMSKESLRYTVSKDSEAVQTLSTGDGTSDVFWESPRQGMSAVRQLVLQAYNSIHSPKNGEIQNFLASQTAKV